MKSVPPPRQATKLAFRTAYVPKPGACTIVLRQVAGFPSFTVDRGALGRSGGVNVNPRNQRQLEQTPKISFVLSTFPPSDFDQRRLVDTLKKTVDQTAFNARSRKRKKSK